MPEIFPRHTMVKPSPRAWAALMAQRPDLANEPFVAGWADAGYPLVTAAERAMFAATGGVNTHRGAIFGLGLLAAAAGFRHVYGIRRSLGAIIAERWGQAILTGPVSLHSHGADAARRYGAGGARAEAAQGLPSIYEIALPALRAARAFARGDEAARVHACMALIASVEDTNLLHRGGPDGLAFAQAQASNFLAEGGVAQTDWQARATAIHRAFTLCFAAGKACCPRICSASLPTGRKRRRSSRRQHAFSAKTRAIWCKAPEAIDWQLTAPARSSP
jgi:hypothetical protein